MHETHHATLNQQMRERRNETEGTEENNQTRNAERTTQWLKRQQEPLPKEKARDRDRKHKLSTHSEELLKKRGRAQKDRNLQEFEKLTKEIRKSRQEDKTQRILEALDKELDIRDRWLGIRELKGKYNPTPYHNKDTEGKHIKWKERAQKAANQPKKMKKQKAKHGENT